MTIFMDGPSPASAQREPVDLSAREVEVLREWVMCDSKTEVGSRLFIAGSTVSTHIARIRSKYGSAGRPAPTKASLLARALQDGHVDLDEL